jgi:hypothetical protein
MNAKFFVKNYFAPPYMLFWFVVQTFPCAVSAIGQTFQQPASIDFRFHYLRETAKLLKQAETGLPATIRFHDPPSNRLLDTIEQLGVSFQWHNNTRLGSATVSQWN